MTRILVKQNGNEIVFNATADLTGGRSHGLACDRTDPSYSC